MDVSSQLLSDRRSACLKDIISLKTQYFKTYILTATFNMFMSYERETDLDISISNGVRLWILF